MVSVAAGGGCEAEELDAEETDGEVVTRARLSRPKFQHHARMLCSSVEWEYVSGQVHYQRHGRDFRCLPFERIDWCFNYGDSSTKEPAKKKQKTGNLATKKKRRSKVVKAILTDCPYNFAGERD